jgi:uncharacterized membrane protein
MVDLLNFPNLFGKKNVLDDLGKSMPFMITTEFVPYKLYANQKGSVTLNITLVNLTKEPLMSSIVLELPKQLSFGSLGLEKEKEIRLGVLSPSEHKNNKIEIYSNTSTDKGDYTIFITAFAHYRDYGQVLNSVKKKISLGVA